MLSNTYKNKRVVKLLALLVALISGFVPFLAQAYTGVTVVASAETPVNAEFVESFKEALASGKNGRLRVKVIDLQEVEKLVVAENSELVVALGVKALEAVSYTHLDVYKRQGVGYEVEVPMSTFYNLPELGAKVSLLTHFVVREDAQLLYCLLYTSRCV